MTHPGHGIVHTASDHWLVDHAGLLLVLVVLALVILARVTEVRHGNA